MKPSELFEALHALITERVPLHIWGACGVGKSQIVARVASDLGWQFLDIRAVQLDPVDLRGLPRISADQAEWVPPKFLPTSGKGILFLDELTAAPQMTQAGGYQLVLDRKLGEYHLPDGWVVVAAGNPASERGVHFSMPRPLRNRFAHLSLEPDFEDWCQWAVRAGLRPEIIAFLRFKPALLHHANATSDVNAWPTPRSWEMASNVLSGFARREKSGFFTGATEIEAQLLEGTVGPAATTELVAFLRLFRDLPSIDEILLNPDSAPFPDELSAHIAIATALGRVLSDHSIAKGMQYLDRMRIEMHVLAIRDAAARIGASPIRRSLFASVSNMRRSCNDHRTSHAGRSPYQYLDCGETRPENQPRRRPSTRRTRGRGAIQQTTAPRCREAGCVAETRPPDSTALHKITLAWSDEGYRLLPAHFYFELTTQMREFERAFSQSVEEFLEVYRSYIEQVRPELNGLFREEDYPSTKKLRAKFGVKLEVLPIPSGDDFRVTLSEEEQARVAREIDASVRQSLNRGTKDLRARRRTWSRTWSTN